MKRARGRTTRTPGKMNGLETAWAKRLDIEKEAGRIARWYFEPVSLRLAKGSGYKPDFMVIDSDGFVEFHECKGFMREAANVRLKVAADMFPAFVFRLVRKSKETESGFLVTVVGAPV